MMEQYSKAQPQLVENLGIFGFPYFPGESFLWMLQGEDKLFRLTEENGETPKSEREQNKIINKLGSIGTFHLLRDRDPSFLDSSGAYRNLVGNSTELGTQKFSRNKIYLRAYV